MKTIIQQQRENADKASEAAGLVCPLEEDKARPEWEAECNIHSIIKRLEAGYNVPMRDTAYDVIADYTLDAESMRAANEDLAQSYAQLPRDIREKLSPSDFLQRALTLATLDPAQLALELNPSQNDTPPAGGEKTPNS